MFSYTRKRASALLVLAAICLAPAADASLIQTSAKGSAVFKVKQADGTPAVGVTVRVVQQAGPGPGGAPGNPGGGVAPAPAPGASMPNGLGPITLAQKGTKVIASGKTDSQGVVDLRNLPVGSLTYRVGQVNSPAGYKSGTFDVKANQATQVEVSLEVRK